MKSTFRHICTYAFMAVAALGSLAACTGPYSDINTDEHKVTEEMLEMDNMKTGAFFAQMQERVVLFDDGTGNALSSDYQVSQGLSHDLFSGYIGPTGTWRSGVHNGSYSFVDGWYNQMFTRGFGEIMPAWQRVKEISTEQNLPQVGALADIVKVEGMHRVTDTYGPIPYCHFGQGSLNVPYDRQSDVYKQMLAELDSAIDVLTPYAEAGATLLKKFDFVYDGDVRAWVKFANTLRLRLALRIVYADPELAKAEGEKSAANSIGFIEAASERAQLLHNKLSYFHPNYDIAYNFNAGEIRMSASMDSYMNGYSDPRLAAYFKPAATDNAYHGVRLGVHNVDPTKYAGDRISNLNVDKTTTPIVWMTAAESFFLRAEAAIRGWDMGGTAQDFYNNGIRASFEENGVSGADSYLRNTTRRPARYVDRTGDSNSHAAMSTITVAWDESADFETKLEKIITQKWIAMYPDGPEGWAEYRRTGYPRLFPVVNNDSNGAIDTDIQVRRCPFPTSEYRTNATILGEAIPLLTEEALGGGGDNGGTRLWWDKNPNH